MWVRGALRKDTMKEIVLKAEKRDVTGKQVRALRREGKLPAVIYGPHIASQAIMFDFREANRLLAGLTSSHLIMVDLDGEKHTTLIKEKQKHPVRGTILHIDFRAVSLTEKLKANVVIELVGDAPAVKELNGVIVTGQEYLEVECLPRYLPERIIIDISSLTKIGDSIHVSDVKAPENVEILTNLSEMVILVTAPAVEEVAAVTEEAAGEEPEVIEKGKKEEEED
jgi:large subunit ribosomal protein L25